MDEELSLIGQTKTPLNHTRDVHFLSWAFLFIFLAYGAVQNLESTINTVSFVSVSFIKIVSFLLLLLNFDVMIDQNFSLKTKPVIPIYYKYQTTRFASCPTDIQYMEVINQAQMNIQRKKH